MVSKKAIPEAPIKIGEQKVEPKKVEKVPHPLITSRERKSGIGRGIQPKRDLTRFVKWPKYVRIQRQEKILHQRLKAPPAIHQFSITLHPKITDTVYKFSKKYRPETKKAKENRLRNVAKSKIAATKAGTTQIPSLKKPFFIKYGLNHVTTLIEQKKALLVLIADDVYPLEIVVWLPALCRKMGVPYCIVKNKARLGSLVNKKTSSVACFTRVRSDDKKRFEAILKSITTSYNPAIDLARKRWSTPKLGLKSRMLLEAKRSSSQKAGH